MVTINIETKTVILMRRYGLSLRKRNPRHEVRVFSEDNGAWHGWIAGNPSSKMLTFKKDDYALA